MSKDKRVWQIQRSLGASDTDMPEWRDICSEPEQPGPATKVAATAFMHRLREAMPGTTYRIVKVSPL